MSDELAQRTTESSGPAADGGATVAPETVRTSASEPDLTDPSLYFNRELSWLDFNDRVLQLAEDPRVPLLERVNFCAIYQDNLDEFFMVRVAGLHDQVEGKVDARGADGLTFVPLEDVIAANLDDLFPGMEIVHHSLFRVTRDTDYDVSDEADDLLLAVEEEMRRRRFGEIVRLEISPDMEPRLRDQLVEAMDIDHVQVYEVP